VSATNEMEVFHLSGRPVQAAERSAPTVEDCYRNLVAAIFLQARKDLREPGYRVHASRWLRSNGARHYAEMLGIEPDALENLLHGRSGR
jgi:hypothetical protein